MCHLFLSIAISDLEHKEDLQVSLNDSLQVCHCTYRETGFWKGKGTCLRTQIIGDSSRQEEYNSQLQYIARQVFPKLNKHH